MWLTQNPTNYKSRPSSQVNQHLHTIHDLQMLRATSLSVVVFDRTTVLMGNWFRDFDGGCCLKPYLLALEKIEEEVYPCFQIYMDSSLAKQFG